MKVMKHLVITIAVATSMAVNVQAKVWRVNNTPGVDADFTTYKQAHDGASEGDTLLFEGSPTQYGKTEYGSEDTLSKKLVIIGSGYFLDQNDTTNDNVNAAKMGNLYIDSMAAGSSIYSMEFGDITVDADSIMFSRNYVRGHVTLADNNSVKNIVITKNYVKSDIWTRWNIYGKIAVDIIISNNVVGTTSTGGDIKINDEGSSAMVFNNVCFGTIKVNNSTVKNNITSYLNENTGNSIEYNIVFHTAPAGTGNKGDVDYNAVFLSYTDDGTYSTDGRLQLATVSPALGAGENEIDCGIFGGNDPYILSGYPPIPVISNIEMPATATDSITVKIKARYQK
jgi:hypothetical protein